MIAVYPEGDAGRGCVAEFLHEPPGVEPHDLILTTSWDTDEPEHLICETCGVVWTVGPRIQQIGMCES